MKIGDAPRGDQVLVRERDDSALAHDRLEEDRRGVAVDRRFERGDVIRRNERNARYERRERLAIRVVARQRQRAEGASVKAFFERDELRLFGREPRKLQRGLVRLRAAVAEERAVESRRAHELLAEDPL